MSEGIHTRFRIILARASTGHSTIFEPFRCTWNNRHVQGLHVWNSNPQIQLGDPAATKTHSSGVYHCRTNGERRFTLRKS